MSEMLDRFPRLTLLCGRCQLKRATLYLGIFNIVTSLSLYSNIPFLLQLTTKELCNNRSEFLIDTVALYFSFVSAALGVVLVMAACYSSAGLCSVWLWGCLELLLLVPCVFTLQLVRYLKSGDNAQTYRAGACLAVHFFQAYFFLVVNGFRMQLNSQQGRNIGTNTRRFSLR